jgi:hypothetical protein
MEYDREGLRNVKKQKDQEPTNLCSEFWKKPRKLLQNAKLSEL